MQGFPKAGKAAPDFSGKATDGKTYSLKSTTADGPVFVYFIKIGCPSNGRAAPHMVALDKAYKGKGNVIGVINGTLKEAQAWAKEFKAEFPIIPDEKLKTIRAYGAPYSPFVVVVGKDGKMSKVFEGLNETELKTVSGLVATSLGEKPAKLSFKGAPEGGG